MPRLPRDYTRSETLAQSTRGSWEDSATWEGRVRAQGGRDQRAQRLADFRFMMRAAKKFGPVTAKNRKQFSPYVPPPEDSRSREAMIWRAIKGGG